MRSCGIAGRWALKPTIAASRIALNSNARSGVWRAHAMRSRSLEHHRAISMILRTKRIRFMSKQDDNKAVVGRWFTEFWGKSVNLAVVDEIAAPDMLLKYSLHAPRRGHDDIKAFMTDFRAAFPDLNFWGTAGLIAEGDHVVGQWEGGGTHTGPAFSDFLVGSLPPAPPATKCASPARRC
jgi:SnoaL-like polyketide cyclase